MQKPIRTYKRNKDSETSDFTMPKKTAKLTTAPTTTVNTFNYFTLLTATMTTTTATPSTSSAVSQPLGPNKSNQTPTPPAIGIENKHATFRLLLSLKTTLEKEYVASFNSQGLRVQCSAQEDYATLQMLLSTAKVQYFTYLATRQNYAKVILRGLPPNIAEEDILDELQGMKFPVISVRQLKKTQVDPDTEIRTKVPLPVWLLTLKNEAGAKDSIVHLKSILNLMIKIEEYEGSATPMECYRCQRFGHKAQGCNLQAKCVKCAGDHNTRECTKDPISPATCSNCSGSHSANYRQCPKFIAYSKPFTSPTQTPPAPPPEPSSFPRLKPTRGPIPNFKPRETPQETNNMMSDFKDILSLIKSFNIRQYISKIKQTISEAVKQPDIISKCLTFFSGLCSLFDNGSQN